MVVLILAQQWGVGGTRLCLRLRLRMHLAAQRRKIVRRGISGLVSGHSSAYCAGYLTETKP